MAEVETGYEQFADEDRVYAGSHFKDVVAALFLPLLPFVLIALAVVALTRHSRAASVYPN